MVEKMSGRITTNKITVLEDEDTLAITDTEKANLLGRAFAIVHSRNYHTNKEKKNSLKIMKMCIIKCRR